MAKNKKKSLDQVDVYKSVRKGWEINPRSRITPDKKSGKYNRSREKQEWHDDQD